MTLAAVGETVSVPLTIFPTWEATILTTESAPVALLEPGFSTQSRATMATVLDLLIGGHMEKMHVWTLQLNLAMWPAASGERWMMQLQ